MTTFSRDVVDESRPLIAQLGGIIPELGLNCTSTRRQTSFKIREIHKKRRRSEGKVPVSRLSSRQTSVNGKFPSSEGIVSVSVYRVFRRSRNLESVKSSSSEGMEPVKLLEPDPT